MRRSSFKTLSAKFAGKCRECGGAVAVGDTVEWMKGYGVRHTDCSGFGDGHDDDGSVAAARRDNAEYLRGYHEVAAVQAFAPAGSALREQMYREMELAAYHRGEDY